MGPSGKRRFSAAGVYAREAFEEFLELRGREGARELKRDGAFPGLLGDKLRDTGPDMAEAESVKHAMRRGERQLRGL